MFKLIFVIFLIFITSCSNKKVTYWCGDHACINKKERELYFKKTMIVEIKELKNVNLKNKSDIEKITQQIHKDEAKLKKEKNLIKQAKLEEKKRVKMEKELAKQIKLEEKRQIKMEKELEKQNKIIDKKRIKKEKSLLKKTKKHENPVENKKKSVSQKVEIIKEPSIVNNSTSVFEDLVNKIINRNSIRPFPNINDIPN